METGIKQLVMEEIVGFAKQNGITKVILFGSRARGDYHRASDIDLAVRGKNVTGFTLDVQDSTSTLLEFDVVDLDSNLQDAFRREIMREGVVIYEEI